jgi:hypothetical protein
LRFCVVPLASFLGFDAEINQRRQLITISYNEETLEEAIIFALKKTLELAVPELVEIHDHDSCIAFYIKYRIDMIRFAHKFSNDSLLLIKANNHNTFTEEFLENLDKHIRMQESNGIRFDDELYKKQYNGFYDSIVEKIAKSRDKVYSDPELYAQAIAEMERRKIVNLEVIRSYGVNPPEDRLQ